MYLSRFIGACFKELEVATTIADGQAVSSAGSCAGSLLY